MIIAVDFDGILCKNKFPRIGDPNYEMISFVRRLIDGGHEVILWTSRTGDRLTEAVDWCRDRGLHFCSINENAPSNMAQYSEEYPVPSPKVYADMYLDDRCPWFFIRNTNATYDRTIHALIEYTEDTIKIMKSRKSEGENDA